MRIHSTALAIALGLATGALAQTPWNSIDQRRAELNQRIDAGIQDGQITRDEAASLRQDFQRLVELERTYRANGLNAQERRDLDRRFSELSDRVRAERRDQEANVRGRGMSVDRRMAMTRQRIADGERGGVLSLGETVRLRADMRDIEALRVRLSAGGLAAQDRALLDRRFDALDEKLQRSEVTSYATAAARR